MRILRNQQQPSRADDCERSHRARQAQALPASHVRPVSFSPARSMTHMTALAAAGATIIRSTVGKLAAYRGDRARPSSSTPDSGVPAFTELVYELIDAHADTAELASGLALDGDWLAHLEYLRALQRQARSVLAQLSASPLG